MKTLANRNFPEIEWEITSEILEHDPDERILVKTAKGLDSFGNKYSGSAYYIGGQFDDIRYIELQ
jgi:hypothetical protein